MASKVKDCPECGKPCDKSYAIIGSDHFHPECFVCSVCKENLAGKPFVKAPQDGKFYDEPCYYEKNNPKCAHCEQRIQGQYIQALGAYWCENHFLCSECGCEFPEDQFHKLDNKPYCREHYLALVSENCAKCNKIIEGDMFEGMDQKFHLECFVCSKGDHVIGEDVNFHVVEGKVWCVEHFEERFFTDCTECKKRIEGEYLKIGKDKMHPECFKCTTCQAPISPMDSSQDQGKFYCNSCHTPKAKAVEAKAAVLAKAVPAAVPVAAKAVPAKTSPFAEPGSAFFAYEALTKTTTTGLSEKVNPSKKEAYLSDEDFLSAMGVTKERFYKLPKWKQTQKKKKVKLF